MGYNNSDNRGSRPSGGRSFGRRDFGGSTGPRQMHRAVCDSCGKDCEVPFRPSGEKPVYCSDCFEKNKDTEPRRFEDRGFRQPRFESRESRPPRFESRDSQLSSQNNEQFNALNVKLDRILAILNAPKTQAIKEVKTVKDLPLPSKDQVVIVDKKKKTSKKTNRPSKV